MVTHGVYGDVCVLGGQPRHCICIIVPRGLSATAEFLVQILVPVLETTLKFEQCHRHKECMKTVIKLKW